MKVKIVKPILIGLDKGFPEIFFMILLILLKFHPKSCFLVLGIYISFFELKSYSGNFSFYL